MFALVDWSKWWHNAKLLFVVFGSLFSCGLCLGTTAFLWHQYSPIYAVDCGAIHVEVQNTNLEFGPKTVLVYSVTGLNQQGNLETSYHDALAGFSYQEVGRIMGQCEGSLVSFTLKASDGMWDTYEVCVGQVCPDRKPKIKNLG